jgi:putative DNA primase/helicase
LRGALRAMASEASALATSRGPAPVLVRLSDIAPEDVSWLWPGRLARGKFTMLAGDPGLGKSFVTLDAAARITTGQCWPDGGAAPRGDVILLSAEDGAADTIRPRVDAMGGDCDRIHILQAVRQADAERSFSLAHDLPALDQAIAQTRATLLVIDPLSAYLGKTDSYKDAEVRGLLAPLATLATHHGTAVLLVMHLTKNNQTRAIYRTAGSIAFVAGARVSLLVGKDPDDEARRLLVANKNNLTVASAALAYRIVGGPEPGRGAARVEWEPDPVIGAPDADALLAGSAEDPEDRRDADALLLEELANGARPSNDLFRAARANSISESTLNRAKRRLRIRARHQGQPGKSGGAWYWHLPEPPLSPSPPKDVIAVPPKGVIPTEVTPFEELEDKTDEIPHASPKGVSPTEVTPFEDPLGRDGTLRSRPPVAGEERL